MDGVVDAQEGSGIDGWIGREVGDVEEAGLGEADVDEGAEAGDVGDDAGEGHAGPDVREGVDVGVELDALDGGTGVAGGFTQLVKDVPQSGQADGGGDVTLEGDMGQEGGLGEEVGDGEAEVGGETVDDGVGLGVDGGVVQRVGSAGDAEEGGGLLEGFWAEARDGEEIPAALEGAVLGAVEDDGFGEGGGVEGGADGGDGGENGVVERFSELLLIDIMLVLADADGLGVELDELGEGSTRRRPMETAERMVGSRCGSSRRARGEVE